jgi:pilus assembly protein CpaB
MGRPLVSALVAALLISGACTYLLSRKMTGHPSAATTKYLHYVTPSRPLQAGEALKADNLELSSWPASNPLSGASTQVSDLVGRVVLYPLEKGQPILERSLAAPGSAAGLAGKIPAGMRAIALRSDEVVGVAGFLTPGSHLDVLASYRTDKAPEPITVTVLQDAVVLAAGQQIEPDPAGKPSAVTVVTLLLTPEESERAFLASNQGTIHFVLRNGADQGRSRVSPVYLSQLAQNGDFLPEKKPATLNLPPRYKEMEPRETGIETVLGDGETSAKPNGEN